MVCSTSNVQIFGVENLSEALDCRRGKAWRISLCKTSLSSTLLAWLFAVLGLSFASEMYCGIGGRGSLSEVNLRECSASKEQCDIRRTCSQV